MGHTNPIAIAAVARNQNHVICNPTRAMSVAWFYRAIRREALVDRSRQASLEHLPSAEKMNAASRLRMSVASRQRSSRRVIKSRNFFLPTCTTSQSVTHAAVRL